MLPPATGGAPLVPHKCKLAVGEAKSEKAVKMFHHHDPCWCLSAWLEIHSGSCLLPRLKLLHFGVFHQLLSSAAKLAGTTAAATAAADTLLPACGQIILAGICSDFQHRRLAHALLEPFAFLLLRRKLKEKKMIFLSFQIQHQPLSPDVAERHQRRGNQSAAKRVEPPQPLRAP